MNSYIVATIKPWNMTAFFVHTLKLPGTWELVSDPKQLLHMLEHMNPRYIFFPHWSWKVPNEIIEKYECVGFHMTDLPYGRGGSPLQNLIVRGHKNTMLTAFALTDGTDTGPVYLRYKLSLEGRAEEIYTRVADMVYLMIDEIITLGVTPVEQLGKPVYFKRRTPGESLLPMQGRTYDLYDHIRMLDAPSYPLAYVDWGDWRIQFHHAELEDGVVEAKAIIGKRS